MIVRAMIAIFCCLVLLGGQAAANTDFDARDFLPHGDLFHFPSGLLISWDGETLSVDNDGQEIQIDQAVDNLGRLRFTSLSSDEGAPFFLQGVIDVLSGGEAAIELGIWYPGGKTDALRAAQIQPGNANNVFVNVCDCADEITFGCMPSDCNDGNKCTQIPSNGKHTCVWGKTRILSRR